MPPSADVALASGALSTLGTLDFSAASGLVSAGDALWVIADDGLELRGLARDGTPHARHALLPGTAPLPVEPKARKKAKPDFEALCVLPDGRLLALGSGSRRNRCRCSVVDLATGAAQEIDAAPLYLALESLLPELNIEGACIAGTSLILAHRGNSEGAEDALVRLDLAQLLADIESGSLGVNVHREVIALALGHLDGVRLTLTDLATDTEGRLCFSAAAERTDNRYEDGPCAGSVVGRFNADLAVEALWRLPGEWKIEGLTGDGPNRWLLVADADDPAVPSPLLVFVAA